MGYKLIITEKPSVAMDIAKIVKAENRNDGYLEGNGYLISWCVGHLVGLYMPDDYFAEWGKWSIKMLPIQPIEWKLKVLERTSKQFRILKELINRDDVDYLINAGDSGTEGEVIQRWVYQMAGNKKPVKRLWISSMTREAIEDGMNHLINSKEKDNLYQAGMCRAKADWLIGINASRLYTLLYNGAGVLSVGRVQTPTLAFIVDRQKEIENFKPTDYFTVNITTNGIKAYWFKENEKSLKTKEEVIYIVEKVRNKKGNVIRYDTETKKENRPQLYDLTELQIDCNKLYHYTSDQVLKAAQSLYEKHKLSTYPRTDSRYLTSDMKSTISDLLELMSKNTYYGEYALKVKENPNVDQRVIDNSKVNDHHAIIPTKNIANYDPTTLNDEEKNVFNLIVARFLTVLSYEYIYAETVIIIKCENETFKAVAKVPVNENWKAIERELIPVKNKKEKEPVLQVALKIGDELAIEKCEYEAKKTTPPKLFTEASLLKVMKKPFANVEIEGVSESEIREELNDRGLGTPATRSGIIEELKKREYIKEKGSFLIATKKGITLIDIMPEKLKTPYMTADWEHKMAMIIKGKYSPSTFMREIEHIVKELVKEEKVNPEKVQFESSNHADKKCPLCGKELKKYSWGYSCSGYKADKTGCNFSISEIICKKKLTDKQIESLITKGATTVIKGFTSKAGKKFDAKLSLDKQTGKIGFDFSNK